MSSLDELQARKVLAHLGLDGGAPVERMPSVSNEVWMTPSHVLRMSRDPVGRLAREAVIAQALPRGIGYPTPIGTGRIGHLTFFVVERVEGQALSSVWPLLTDGDRERVVRSLGTVLATLHATPTPELPALDDPPQPLDVADPIGSLLRALDRAMAVDGVDTLAIRSASDFVDRSRGCLMSFRADTLIHGDMTFQNVLWHDGQISAVLDFEYCRGAPPDLELDILLRMCGFPELFVDEAHAAAARRTDYQMIPSLLAESHPSLFSVAGLLDRLRLYELGFAARELSSVESVGPIMQLSAGHPHRRITDLLDGKSYLDRLELPR